MKRHVVAILACVACGFMGAMAQAQGSTSYLECTTQSGGGQLMPAQIIVATEQDSGKVTVADTGGVKTGQLPAVGKVTRNNASRLVVSWQRKARRDSAAKQQPRVLFKLDLKKRTGAAQVNMQEQGPHGLRPVKRAKSRCAPMNAKQVAQITKLLRSPQLRREIKKGDARVQRMSCALDKQPAGIAFLDGPFVFELPKYGREASVADAFGRKHTGGKIRTQMDQEKWPEVRLSWELSGLSAAQMRMASQGLASSRVRMQAQLDRKTGAFSLRVRTHPSLAPKLYKGSCTGKG